MPSSRSKQLMTSSGSKGKATKGKKAKSSGRAEGPKKQTSSLPQSPGSSASPSPPKATLTEEVDAHRQVIIGLPAAVTDDARRSSADPPSAHPSASESKSCANVIKSGASLSVDGGPPPRSTGESEAKVDSQPAPFMAQAPFPSNLSPFAKPFSVSTAKVTKEDPLQHSEEAELERTEPERTREHVLRDAKDMTKSSNRVLPRNDTDEAKNANHVAQDAPKGEPRATLDAPKNTRDVAKGTKNMARHNRGAAKDTSDVAKNARYAAGDAKVAKDEVKDSKVVAKNTRDVPEDKKMGVSEASKDDCMPVDIPKPMKHPLLHEWTLWFFKNDSTRSWEANQHQILTVAYIEDFWSLYHHVPAPSDMKPGTDYSLFKKGVKPFWEDPKNSGGGRWMASYDRRVRSILDDVWLNTMLFLIGSPMDEYQHGQFINGAVINFRPKAIKIGLWINARGDRTKICTIGERWKEELHMGKEEEFIAFEAHSDRQLKTGSLIRSQMKI